MTSGSSSVFRAGVPSDRLLPFDSRPSAFAPALVITSDYALRPGRTAGLELSSGARKQRKFQHGSATKGFGYITALRALNTTPPPPGPSLVSCCPPRPCIARYATSVGIGSRRPPAHSLRSFAGPSPRRPAARWPRASSPHRYAGGSAAPCAASGRTAMPLTPAHAGGRQGVARSGSTRAPEHPCSFRLARSA